MFKKFLKAQDNPSKMQVFYNNYLALPYEDVEFRITDEVLQKCARADSEDRALVSELLERSMCRTVAGIDQGRLFTIVVKTVANGKLYDLYYGVVDTWEQLESLLNYWNVTTTVIDAQGGGYNETREFARKRGERWMCYYRPKDQVAKEYKLKHEDAVVDTNRTELLDAMVTRYKQQKIVIPISYKTECEGDFYKEMRVPTRIVNEKGAPEWTKGKDHFFHASAYSHLAWLISGMSDGARKPKSWLVENKVPEGKHDVHAIIDKGSLGITEEEYQEHKKQREKPVRKSWYI
jgi:hypothetical protein